MSGDYEFPRRLLRESGDILDAVELNQQMNPAAERLNARLNQHNIQAPIGTLSSDTSESPFYRISQVFTEVDSKLGTNSPPEAKFTNPASNDRYDIYSTLSWSQVTAPSTGKDMSVRVTTGQSMLEIRAACWYSFHPDEDSTATVPTWAKTGSFGGSFFLESATSATGTVKRYRANVQFALRIDGVVIPSTITGRIDIERRPFYPIRIEDPADPSLTVALGSSFPDPVAEQYNMTGAEIPRLKNRIEGVNYMLYSIRLGTNILVEPGEHHVELVARRCSVNRRGTVEDFVSVYSRQLSVSELTLIPVQTPDSLKTTTVPPFEPEDVFDKTAIHSERIGKIQDSSNNIKSGQLIRGALNRDHFSNHSLVIDQAVGVSGKVKLNPSRDVSGQGVTGTNVNSTMSLSYEFVHPTSSLSWNANYTLWFLPSGSYDIVTTLNSFSPQVTTKNQILKVFANVDLHELSITSSSVSGPGATEPTHACAVAVFALAFELTGRTGLYVWLPGMSYINSANYASYDTDITPSPGVGIDGLRSYPVDADVPILAEFDFSSVLADYEIENIHIVGMVSNVARVSSSGSYGSVQAIVQKASMQALSLRSRPVQ